MLLSYPVGSTTHYQAPPTTNTPISCHFFDSRDNRNRTCLFRAFCYSLLRRVDDGFRVKRGCSSRCVEEHRNRKVSDARDGFLAPSHVPLCHKSPHPFLSHYSTFPSVPLSSAVLLHTLSRCLSWISRLSLLFSLFIFLCPLFSHRLLTRLSFFSSPSFICHLIFFQSLLFSHLFHTSILGFLSDPGVLQLSSLQQPIPLTRQLHRVGRCHNSRIVWPEYWIMWWHDDSHLQHIVSSNYGRNKLSSHTIIYYSTPRYHTRITFRLFHQYSLSSKGRRHLLDLQLQPMWGGKWMQGQKMQHIFQYDLIRFSCLWVLLCQWYFSLWQCERTYHMLWCTEVQCTHRWTHNQNFSHDDRHRWPQ